MSILFKLQNFGAGKVRAISPKGVAPLIPRFKPIQPPIVITGFTLTGAGAPLAFCDIEVFRTSTGALVERLTSDVTGAFSTSPLGLGQTYQMDAYKTGAPNLAGTTDITLQGNAVVNIYLRDPTVADSVGAGGFVGAPVHPYVQQWRYV